MIQHVLDVANTILLGKEKQIRLALTCLIARGHLLIDDVPGVGKTTLAYLLGKILGLSYRRVQFTSDLLPADIVGINIFNREAGAFDFHPGPLFSQLLLADEINRASPKVQSALLEAMEERQVSVDGETHALDSSFFVIATQNPTEQVGTFSLPESQLDRFLMCLSLGYPPEEAELALYMGEERRQQINYLDILISPAQLQDMQEKAQQVKVSESLARYVLRLVQETRQNLFIDGLSPRAGVGMLSAARAWALLQNRDYVLPEDVKEIFPAVASHRLRLRESNVRMEDTIESLLQMTPVA